MHTYNAYIRVYIYYIGKFGCVAFIVDMAKKKKRQNMKTLKKILHNSDFSEKSIEHYLVERVKAMGGECLKYSNPHAIGYPDRIVLLPIGVTLWVELKSKGERLRPLQQQRFNQLARMGQKAYVCDSREDIDRVLEPYKLKRP